MSDRLEEAREEFVRWLEASEDHHDFAAERAGDPEWTAEPPDDLPEAWEAVEPDWDAIVDSRAVGL